MNLTWVIISLILIFVKHAANGFNVLEDSIAVVTTHAVVVSSLTVPNIGILPKLQQQHL